MTNNDKNSLSQRQIQALPIFASIANCDAACKQAGISRNCFYEWLKQPQFKEELESLRNELIQDAINQLKISAKQAVITLISLTEREDNPGVQRAAANDILNQIIKYKEIMEMETRVTNLEIHLRNKF